jgi:hypothetical protein
MAFLFFSDIEILAIFFFANVKALLPLNHILTSKFFPNPFVTLYNEGLGIGLKGLSH